jgi:predicted dehydrogenase
MSTPAPGRPLRVAIIGTGMIAQVHRRSALLAGARVAAVVGSSADAARATATAWGADAVAGFDDLLASDIDVIHICSPNATHADYALRAIAAGKHVVCEKPLGLTAAEARRMADAARASGLVAAVPFVYRYHPIVRELRARRIAGELGDLHLVHGSYLQDWMLDPAAGGWRVDRAAGGASRAFADIGSHWCDLVEWVTGERFASVTAATSIAYPVRPASGGSSFAAVADAGPKRVVETEDVAAGIFRTTSGLLATVTVSQVSAGRKNRLWFEVDGSRASAVFDQENPESAWLGGPVESRVVVRDPQTAAPDARRLSTLPAGHAQGYQQCFDGFVADVYDAIGGGAPEGLPTFADGVRTAETVEALLASASSGAWTPIARPRPSITDRES